MRRQTGIRRNEGHRVISRFALIVLRAEAGGGGVIGGVLFVAGGCCGTIRTTLEAYSPLLWPATALMGGILYALGGLNSGFDAVAINEAYTP